MAPSRSGHDRSGHGEAESTATHAAAMRARKQAEAQAIGITADYIGNLVDLFYARIRDDSQLGPIFAGRITDWAAHLTRMKAFWRSVLLNSGEYSGNPMMRHIAIHGLEKHHFAHWLDLFYQTLRTLEPDPRATTEVAQRARMIAESLFSGIVVQRKGVAGYRAAQDLPHLPHAVQGR